MMQDNEFITAFMDQSLENSVNDLMLSNKNYVVPKENVTNYIKRALDIPYLSFINYIKVSMGVIDDEQITQSSSFSACSTEMCKALMWHGNPGMKFIDIGRLFPQYIRVCNESSYRKYGENQIKTSKQLGLAFDFYGYWYLSCVGYVFNDLSFEQQESFLARSILRTPLYRHLLIHIFDRDLNLTDYMKGIADSTKGRRAGSIIKLLKICLKECIKEKITFYDIYYPSYIQKTKTIRIDKYDMSELDSLF